MTRWFYTFILSVLFLSAPAQAAEKILSFDSRIAIQPDSSVIVTEIITVTAEQQEIRRGIYRTLPNKYTLPGGRTVQPRLDILEVKRDGKTEPYHIQKSSRETKIYIGQENVFLKPGRYTYTLSYQMGGMVLFEQDYDELAWNVTGTQWAFPIEKATAHVILPNGAPVRSYDAYTGAYGSKDKNFTVRKNIDGSLAFMTTTPLAPRHGITVAVSFPKGYVAEPDMFSASQYDLRPHFMTAAVIGIILFYYILIWLLVGRDLRDEPIIPLFTPPKDISPALCGYIHYMGGISVEKCFAVALVSMATKGAIRIEKEGRKTYKLEKLTGPSAPLSLGEKLLSQKLFTRNARSFTFGKKYSAKAAGAFKTFKKEIIHETGRLYFKKNLLYFVPGVILTLVLMWMIVAKAAFSAYVLILIYIGVLVPDLLLKLVQIPARGFKADMLDIKAILGLLIFIGFFSVMLAEADIVLTIPDMLLGLEFFIIGVITLVFYQLLKAPTIGGRRVMNEIEGFKLFLQTADGEKFRHLDPPEITKELYESYYPYAMALDVEKNWSKKFEAAIISATGEPPGDYHPVWYHGGSFRPGNFSGSMSRGIAAAVTVPSSSSSGGGFSGGGGVAAGAAAGSVMISEDMNDTARAVLRENSREDSYTIPCKDIYPYQWNWDSCFSALGWMRIDESRAWRELYKLFSGQWESGMVPHIIFHQPSDRYFPGPDAWQTATAVPTSGITQPPVAASAVRWMLADSRDQTAAREQVTALFPQIFKYHQWFHDQRDPERTGLVALYHPWESGRDNSAEWDKPLSCVPTDRLRPYERRDLDLIDPEQRPRQQDYDRFVALMQIFIDHSYDQRALYIHSPFRVADLGVNMILLRANRDLLALARQIGQTAATCMTIADWISLQEQAREKLWDPQTQAFHSLDLRTGKRLPQITSAAFLPFYGGALPEPYQGPILERLKAWEDQLSFLLPSLAPDDPAFEPERYWRGPVWPVVNFLAATGLAEHGHRLQAERIRTDTAALIRDGGLREYYDPRNGAALGGDHFSWTAAMWLYWAGRQS